MMKILLYTGDGTVVASNLIYGKFEHFGLVWQIRTIK